MKLLEQKYDLSLTNQEKEFIPKIINFFNDLGENICNQCENCENCPFFEGCSGVFDDDRPDVSLRIFFQNILDDDD